MNTNTIALRRTLAQLLLVALLLAAAQATQAQTQGNSSPAPTTASPLPDFTYSARDKIQLGKRRIRHKVVLKIVNLNPVRYIYSVTGERVIVAETVDLSKLPFLAPIPSAGAAPDATPATPQAGTATVLDLQVSSTLGQIAAAEKAIADDQDKINALGSRGKSSDRSKAKKKLEEDQKGLERLKETLADLLKKKVLEDMKKKTSDDITAAYNKIQARRTKAENDVSGVEIKANSVRDSVELAKREVDSLISKSNDDIGPSDPAGTSLLDRVGTAIVNLANAVPPVAKWPDFDIAKVKSDLQTIQSDLDSLPVQFPDGWPDWIKNAQNAVAFRTLGDRVKALTTYLDTLKPIRDEWDKQVAKLIDVRAFLVGIRNQGESAFTRTLLPFDCGSGIDNTPIKLTITDRTGADPKEQTFDMVTFECASPLSVSSGIAFSTRDENEFSLINQVRPGTGGGPPTLEQFKVIGSDKRSRFRPIPVLLLNTRIHDFSSDLGLHFSFGAGVDVKTGKTGSDLEFLVGPSLLLKDRFFFTVGAHIGREIRLQDGFKLGQAVPNDLAAAPTFKRYTTGLGIAFTYRLK